MVTRFGLDGVAAEQRIAELGPAGRQALREWLRVLSPVRQYIARHSRTTLKAYRQRGLISENLADRDVQPHVVGLEVEEQQLYADLEALIERLMFARRIGDGGSCTGCGEVLTVTELLGLE
jgi:hypothetical protein